MDYFFEVLAFFIKVATIGLGVFAHICLCVFLYLNYGLIPFILYLFLSTVIFLIIEKKFLFLANFFKEVGYEAEKTGGGNRYISLLVILKSIVNLYQKESEIDKPSVSDTYYTLAILFISILILFTLYILWN